MRIKQVTRLEELLATSAACQRHHNAPSKILGRCCWSVRDSAKGGKGIATWRCIVARFRRTASQMVGAIAWVELVAIFKGSVLTCTTGTRGRSVVKFRPVVVTFAPPSCVPPTFSLVPPCTDASPQPRPPLRVCACWRRVTSRASCYWRWHLRPTSRCTRSRLTLWRRPRAQGSFQST